jgi:hypothetical protein
MTRGEKITSLREKSASGSLFHPAGEAVHFFPFRKLRDDRRQMRLCEEMQEKSG